ncbi:gamma-glutamylcyclotransferase family protein [Spirosoma pomorum]
MDTDPDFLFVYGTLGPSFGNPCASLLHQNSQYVGPGRLTGLLVNLGDYPAATYNPYAATFVHGYIYNISTRKTELLEILDAYEGIGADFPELHEYVRTISPVHVNSKIIFCWTYLYNLDIHSHSPIDSGNYLSFLEGK